MGVRADHQRCAAVQEVADRLFFAGGLGMHVDHNGIDPCAQLVPGQSFFERHERVVERIHEQPPHDVDHQHDMTKLALEQA